MPAEGSISRRVAPAGLVLALAVSLTAGAAVARAAVAPTSTSAEVRFFETHVRPLLVSKCLACHGKKKQWGGLRLDSRKGLLKGGESGTAIVVGKPDASRLIQAVKDTDPKTRMPRNGKLTPHQIGLLVRWVEMGAPFPDSAGAKRRLRDPDHWSFQTPGSIAPPEVRDGGWVRSPIDRFVLARLEAQGLRPAGGADRRTMLRRVTYGLVGLPPTPGEIELFLADLEPGALSRVVDRLLASSRYGQRWGRHWLDVARYADSNGFDENVAHGNAWRYRDYVVDSFNRDTPFDEFVIEQLAGDLMPFSGHQQQHDRLIATGFLSIGPKVLAETDQAKMRMDIIDEQLDTVGRAFLGLTLGCARCHDHKFDPVDTAEYYALAGIFKSTLTMRKYNKVAEWHEHLLPSPQATAMQKAYDASVSAARKQVATAKAAADAVARKKLESESSRSPKQKLEDLYPAETKARLKKLKDALAALEKAGPDLPAAMGVTEDKIVDVAIHLRGDPQQLGEVARRRTPAVLKGPPQPQFSNTQSGRLQLARWLVDRRHPLTARVLVNRIWRWHFGRGLVRTTDNFGLLGERPSHPGLLDWLALRFMQDGWSIKRLHRVIVLSATYGQSTVADPLTRKRDPENSLLGRARVRRLEAEAVRDALLAAAGQLDGTMKGSLLKLKNRAYFFDHTSKDLTTYDSNRRSIYLPVVRNNVFDLFQLLDFPDPAVTTGDRATTVVASQALLMLNSDLVMQAASGLAARLLSEADGVSGRIARMYEIALGRPPTASELRADHALLLELAKNAKQVDKKTPATAGGRAGVIPLSAWTTLCHVALASNEFIYLR